MTEHRIGTQDTKRWIALYVLCVGMLMIVLDATVVNAYLIAVGGLLLLAGRFGDILGRRSVFLAGLGVFTVASLLCGVAQSQEVLVAARFVQGVGGAMTSAVILGMIVTMFPEPREQAKAIGVYGFVASAGGSVGLLAGGLLTQSINWHWIFFVNIPIAIATAVLAMRLVDKDKGIGFGDGADIPGAVLITSSLMLGVYTIVKPAADYGWGSGRALGLAAVSLALLVAFVVREARARNPLIPLRIFRSRNVTGANVIQALLVAGMFGLFFLGALYLERVLGYSALEIGFAFLPTTIVMGILSLRYSERLIMRFGARTTLLPGMVLIAAGLALFSLAPVDGSYVAHVLPPMILLGFGVGVSFPALMTLAMSGATQEDAGLASGLVNTTAQVGGALGRAVLATLSSTRSDSLIGDGHSKASALTSGYHLAFLVGAGLVVAAIVTALTVLQPEEQAEKQAAREAGRAGAEPAAEAA
jgi:EmrB/QacA subfamily drug resistance transporter